MKRCDWEHQLVRWSITLSSRRQKPGLLESLYSVVAARSESSKRSFALGECTRSAHHYPRCYFCVGLVSMHVQFASVSIAVACSSTTAVGLSSTTRPSCASACMVMAIRRQVTTSAYNLQSVFCAEAHNSQAGHYPIQVGR